MCRAAELEAGIPAFRLFALAGLAGSNGEGRRLIRGGGARINDMPVKDEGHTVTVADSAGRCDQAVGRAQASPAGSGRLKRYDSMSWHGDST